MVKDIEPDDTMDFDYSPDVDQRMDSYFPPVGSAAMERTMSYEPESRIQPHRPMQKLHTAKLLEMILKDTQARLVYRSQAIIKNAVSGYYPKGDDLDYPAKIESGTQPACLHTRLQRLTLVRSLVAAHLFADRERMANSLNLDENEPAFLALPSKETQETWYPTLRTTLWILSCLHTYVEVGRASFQGNSVVDLTNAQL